MQMKCNEDSLPAAKLDIAYQSCRHLARIGSAVLT
jgi:hypothetical protein